MRSKGRLELPFGLRLPLPMRGKDLVKCNAVSADKQSKVKNVMWTEPTPGKRRLATEPTYVAKQPNAAPSSDEPNRAETEELVRALCTQMQRLETTPDNKLGVS